MTNVTPFITPIRTQGGTFYAFSSAIEDVGLSINETNNIVKVSHFALLDIPNINTTDYSITPPSLKNSFNVSFISGAFRTISEETTGGKSVNMRIAESFQNYALNFESNAINANDYDFASPSTVSERVFWKWMKETGSVRWKYSLDKDGEPSHLVEEGSSFSYDPITKKRSIHLKTNHYNNVVKCIGNITTGSVRATQFNSYNETYILVPTSFGQTVSFFKHIKDSNYTYGKQFKQGSNYIFGREGEIQSPTFLSKMAQFDVATENKHISGFNLKYFNEKTGLYNDGWWYDKQGVSPGIRNYVIDKDVSKNVKIASASHDYNESIYYGTNTKLRYSHNDDPKVAYEFVRSNIDCVGLEFDKSALCQLHKFNEQGLEYNSIDDIAIYNSPAGNESFDFNTVLVYYSIYDKMDTSNVMATNLMGVLFLDSPQIVTPTSGLTATGVDIEAILPRLRKNASRNQEFGNSYSFRVNIKSNNISDDTTSTIIDDSTTAQVSNLNFEGVSQSLDRSVRILADNNSKLNAVVKSNEDVSIRYGLNTTKINDLSQRLDGIEGFNVKYVTNITNSIAKSVGLTPDYFIDYSRYVNSHYLNQIEDEPSISDFMLKLDSVVFRKAEYGADGLIPVERLPVADSKGTMGMVKIDPTGGLRFDKYGQLQTHIDIAGTLLDDETISKATTFSSSHINIKYVSYSFLMDNGVGDVNSVIKNELLPVASNNKKGAIMFHPNNTLRKQLNTNTGQKVDDALGLTSVSMMNYDQPGVLTLKTSNPASPSSEWEQLNVDLSPSKRINQSNVHLRVMRPKRIAGTDDTSADELMYRHELFVKPAGVGVNEMGVISLKRSDIGNDNVSNLVLTPSKTPNDYQTQLSVKPAGVGVGEMGVVSLLSSVVDSKTVNTSNLVLTPSTLPGNDHCVMLSVPAGKANVLGVVKTVIQKENIVPITVDGRTHTPSDWISNTVKDFKTDNTPTQKTSVKWSSEDGLQLNHRVIPTINDVELIQPTTGNVVNLINIKKKSDTTTQTNSLDITYERKNAFDKVVANGRSMPTSVGDKIKLVTNVYSQSKIGGVTDVNEQTIGFDVISGDDFLKAISLKINEVYVLSGEMAQQTNRKNAVAEAVKRRDAFFDEMVGGQYVNRVQQGDSCIDVLVYPNSSKTVIKQTIMWLCNKARAITPPVGSVEWVELTIQGESITQINEKAGPSITLNTDDVRPTTDLYPTISTSVVENFKYNKYTTANSNQFLMGATDDPQTTNAEKTLDLWKSGRFTSHFTIAKNALNVEHPVIKGGSRLYVGSIVDGNKLTTASEVVDIKTNNTKHSDTSDLAYTSQKLGGYPLVNGNHPYNVAVKSFDIVGLGPKKFVRLDVVNNSGVVDSTYGGTFVDVASTVVPGATVEGRLNVTQGAYETSDIRKKTNVNNLYHPMDDVSQNSIFNIQAISFEYDYPKLNEAEKGVKRIGYSAQDVKAVPLVSCAVGTDDDGFYTLNTQEVLVAKVQVLEDKIRELTNVVQTLSQLIPKSL